MPRCFVSFSLSLLSLALSLPVSAQSPLVFILYSREKNDREQGGNLAEQHLDYVCSALREAGSRRTIFVLDKADPAVELANALMEGASDRPRPDAPSDSDACAAGYFLGCVTQRMNRHWSTPTNSSLQECFIEADHPKAALPALAVGFQRAAAQAGWLNFQQLLLEEDGVSKRRNDSIPAAVAGGDPEGERRAAIRDIEVVLGLRKPEPELRFPRKDNGSEAWPNWPIYALVGVGVLSAGMATFSTAKYFSGRRYLENRCPGLTSCDPALSSSEGETETYGNVAIGSWVGGVVFGAAALSYALLTSNMASPPLTLRAGCTGRACGLDATGRF